MTFQKNKYIERCTKEGKDPIPEYIEMLEKAIEDHKNKFLEPESRTNNLEYDLLTTDWILEKVRQHKHYAQNLYAAMCNNRFIKLNVLPILKQEEWGCSWRYAGGIISDMRQEGDYIDWYCSGIRDSDPPSEEERNSWSIQQQNDWQKDYSKYVPEGMITEEIRNDLQRLGWSVAPEGDWNNFD